MRQSLNAWKQSHCNFESLVSDKLISCVYRSQDIYSVVSTHIHANKWTANFVGLRWNLVHNLIYWSYFYIKACSVSTNTRTRTHTLMNEFKRMLVDHIGILTQAHALIDIHLSEYQRKSNETSAAARSLCIDKTKYTLAKFTLVHLTKMKLLGSVRHARMNS